ncbi:MULTISPECIES: azurin [Pseudoalteromonas]|uniref:Azurin n=1 Tax=Pseudoalteromonas obscura TaxID=3048491 RepID=A0ABT7EEB1_9GAMM|nr:MULTISPECIES: azurin [Pseudoalteromonas]MBQ4838578.1 azurin [Pseudoalteromonas luteoviolacea]MDK2593623.1 azurin [Pseudoalteromonas sp. P94(2023)]
MKVINKVAVAALCISAFQASANDCELTIESNDMMQFSEKALSVPSKCKEVKLTLVHTGKLPAAAMGHNWVLTEKKNVKAVASDGMRAGVKNSYVKPNDPRVFAYTKVIGGGESTSITFSTKSMSKDLEYNFFCSFPGHFAIMKGSFKIV